MVLPVISFFCSLQATLLFGRENASGPRLIMAHFKRTGAGVHGASVRNLRSPFFQHADPMLWWSLLDAGGLDPLTSSFCALKRVLFLLDKGEGESGSLPKETFWGVKCWRRRGKSRRPKAVIGFRFGLRESVALIYVRGIFFRRLTPSTVTIPFYNTSLALAAASNYAWRSITAS